MSIRHYILVLTMFCGAYLRGQDPCGFNYTITTGCSKDGIGYAIITGLDPNGTFEIRWDGNEATGGPQITGLSEGEHSVAIFNGTDCESVEVFTINCDTPPEENCQFRTQTQGGWGSPANGNNPGRYRNARFSQAFPLGLRIGCSGRWLRLTTAAAVDAFLPTGGPARMLNPGTLVDPGQGYRNVLAGQLVALTLSVGFDAADPAFGAANMTLGNAIIQSGTFQGWTVQELLDEANRFIGGCASSYTAGQLNTALTAANESFVDGTGNSGFLACGPMTKRMVAEPVVQVYPVPANDRLMIEWPAGDAHRLEVYDATGRIALERTVAMNEHIINVNTSTLPEGAYILRLLHAGGSFTRRVSVVH